MNDDDIIIAIEERRFALARRELDKKLKRFPTKSFYKAASAFCAFTMGDTVKAANDATALAKTIPSDPRTLKLLKTIFEGVGKQRDAIDVYANAVRKYPNAELLETWYEDSFMAFDTPLMLNAGKALYLFSKSSADYVSKFAMAQLIAGGSAEDVSLAVQALHDCDLERDSQFYFLVGLLHSQLDEHSKVIALLKPYLPRNLDLTILYLDSLKKNLNWQDLFEECSRLIFEQNFDDYDSWKLLVTAAFKLGKPKDELASLITQSSRNALLATIYMNVTYGDDPLESIEAYYEAFKTKPCCFADLSAFELPEKFVQELLNKRNLFKNQFKLTEEDIAEYRNLEVYCSQVKADPLQTSIESNLELSDFALRDIVQSLNTKVAPHDLIKYVMCLESLSQKDPENFWFKSWLLNLYNMLGISPLVSANYKDLKIKMIQHDTISYKLSLDPSLANLKQLIDIYRFYLTSDAEVNHFLSKAKAEGLYTQIKDLYQFGQKLQFSLSKHLLIAKILKMSRMLNNDNYSYFVNIINTNKWKYLSDNFETFDNRDFEVDYNFQFKIARLELYAGEMSQTTKYVQLLYAKELLLSSNDEDLNLRLVKLFEKWLSQKPYRTTLSDLELQVLKIHLALFKVCKIAPTKDRMDQLNFLVKQLDFGKFKKSFLDQADPLSKRYRETITELVELERNARSLCKESRVISAVKQFKTDLRSFVEEDTPKKALKEIKTSFDRTYLGESFVEQQFKRIEDSMHTFDI